jgi:hypothetical protein
VNATRIRTSFQHCRLVATDDSRLKESGNWDKGVKSEIRKVSRSKSVHRWVEDPAIVYARFEYRDVM